ncbi:MAG: DUF4760 domain-containing protein [Nitrososphaeraceae archaeon]
MEFELALASLIVAIGAALISVITFYIQHKSVRKAEQMKTTMEISSKLDNADNKRFEIQDEIRNLQHENENLSPDQIVTREQNSARIDMLNRNFRDASLHYLNLWEFFSFLVNKEEIDNENIIEYFESNFISGTDDVFGAYDDIRMNLNAFEEIRRLRTKLGHRIN